jgi:hypothetical protein
VRLHGSFNAGPKLLGHANSQLQEHEAAQDPMQDNPPQVSKRLLTPKYSAALPNPASVAQDFLNVKTNYFPRN